MAGGDGDSGIRVDKWLWHARFFKSRSLSAKLISDGRCRINGERVSKPSRALHAGDVLTFPQADVVRVIKMLAAGTRRGPASEAQALYEDLAPHDAAANEGGEGAQKPISASPDAGRRPDRRERKALDRMRRAGFDPDGRA